MAEKLHESVAKAVSEANAAFDKMRVAVEEETKRGTAALDVLGSRGRRDSTSTRPRWRAPNRAPDSGAPMAAVALLVALATALVLVVAPVPPVVPLVLSVVVAPLSLAPVAVLTING